MPTLETEARPDGETATAGTALVIEDDALLRDYVAGLLVAEGYRVCCAAHGLEGWCVYELDQPDVVLLDLDLPVISGFRLLRLLRTWGAGDEPARPPVPVIIMSGYDLQEAHEAAGQALPEAYLKKPFPMDELIGHVHRLIEAYRGALQGAAGAVGAPTAGDHIGQIGSEGRGVLAGPTARTSVACVAALDSCAPERPRAGAVHNAADSPSPSAAGLLAPVAAPCCSGCTQEPLSADSRPAQVLVR